MVGRCCNSQCGLINVCDRIRTHAHTVHWYHACWIQNGTKTDIVLFCFLITAFTGRNRAKAHERMLLGIADSTAKFTHFTKSAFTLSFPVPDDCIRRLQWTLSIPQNGKSNSTNRIWNWSCVDGGSPRALELNAMLPKSYDVQRKQATMSHYLKTQSHQMDQWKWSLRVIVP